MGSRSISGKNVWYKWKSSEGRAGMSGGWQTRPGDGHPPTQQWATEGAGQKHSISHRVQQKVVQDWKISSVDKYLPITYFMSAKAVGMGEELTNGKEKLSSI